MKREVNNSIVESETRGKFEFESMHTTKKEKNELCARERGMQSESKQERELR